MASAKGTMPTEGFPGAPTLTVLNVSTDGAGEAADIAGPASASATRTISAAERRVFRARREAWGSAFCLIDCGSRCMSRPRDRHRRSGSKQAKLAGGPAWLRRLVRGAVALEVEQSLLSLQTPAVAGERTVGTDDPVTGHQDRRRGAADRGGCQPDPPIRLKAVGVGGGLDLAGKLAIADRGSVGDLQELRPDKPLEGGAVEVELQLEGPPLAREVLLELVGRLC